MSITLRQLGEVLDLVGVLDDSLGDAAPRERFRNFLKKNITEIGQVRDYVNECLNNTSNIQYNRALQDLVNYIGHFLGFDVDFGRYKGSQNQIGFDGHWKSGSREEFHIVVETKTSETYPIETSALVGYVNKLIDKGAIPSEDKALGLYVVGKLNPKVSQLENSIVAQKRTHQLRIISTESLLSLAEMMNEYDIEHKDILALLRPSSPTIDPVVSLMSRLVAEQTTIPPSQDEESSEPMSPSEKGSVSKPEQPAQGRSAYWLTPVKGDDEQTAEEVVQSLVGQKKVYAFGHKTPGRKHLKPGDWICFYATSKGIVAHAKVASAPEEKHHPSVRQSDKYPWLFQLSEPEVYLDDPVVIDAEVRSRLNQFEDKNPNKNWAWFVQSTRKLTEHDFKILTPTTKRQV